jgi:hypothetical protein
VNNKELLETVETRLLNLNDYIEKTEVYNKDSLSKREKAELNTIQIEIVNLSNLIYKNL